MKTEDELDAEIAKIFDDVTEVKMVNGKPRISDEATIAEMEREEQARRLEEACGMFLSAERRFQKLNTHPEKVTDPKVNLAWWEALESVYEREKSSSVYSWGAANAGAEQVVRQISRDAGAGQQPQGERLRC